MFHPFFRQNMKENTDTDQEDFEEANETNSSRIGNDESSSSSSEDENSEHCPICLLRLKLQPLGRPEHCKHLYCLSCITQWSKVEYYLLLIHA